MSPWVVKINEMENCLTYDSIMFGKKILLGCLCVALKWAYYKCEFEFFTVSRFTEDRYLPT